MRRVGRLLSIVILVSCHCSARAQERPLKPVVQTGHSTSVSSVAISPNGKYVVTGSHDSTAILWDAASGKQIRTLLGHNNWVHGVAFSGDGKYVVTGASRMNDDGVILWETVSGKKIQSFKGYANEVYSVALTHDGKYLVTGHHGSISADHKGVAILWETAGGTMVRSFEGHTGDVNSVAISGDGKQIVTGSADKTAVLWDSGSGAKLRLT